MTEHGWPDHHDDHDPGAHDDPAYVDDHHDADPAPPPADDDHDLWDLQHDHDHDAGKTDDDLHDLPYEHHTEHTLTTDEPDAQHTAPADEITDTVFPPAVDVGPLPEPVDGFPWIDTGSLGIVDPATIHTATHDPVDPHELAEYAGTELPPGVDPWAALADSDDPATSTLARWWAENQN
jgi:hypothetical protein